MRNKPLKRHPYLQPFSRDHHQQLIFCWNIKNGYSKGVSKSRLIDYSLWFDANYLSPHFLVEDKMLLGINSKDEKIALCIQKHIEITNFFKSINKLENEIDRLALMLESSIRNEERNVFEYVQEHYSQLIDKPIIHNEISCGAHWEDAFWK